MKNKIILSADTDLIDNQLRTYVSKLDKRIDNINERTKKLTLEIKELNKRLKK